MTENTIYPSAWPWRLRETAPHAASVLGADNGGVLDLWLPPGRQFEGFNETDRRNLQLITCAPQLFNRLEESTQFLENLLDFYGHRLKSNAASKHWVKLARSNIKMHRWLLEHARQPWRPRAHDEADDWI